MRRSWLLLFCLVVIVFLVFASGCAKRAPTEASGEKSATCEGCHLSKELLKLTASSEGVEPSGESGEG